MKSNLKMCQTVNQFNRTKRLQNRMHYPLELIE